MKPIPELHESHNEWFSLMTLHFNVSKARALLKAKKHPRIVDVDVEEAVQSISREIRKDDKVTTITLGIRVDWNRVKKDLESADDAADINLSVPIIVAQTKHGNIVIDGYHRIAKAHLRGVKSLRAYVLTKADSEKVLQ